MRTLNVSGGLYFIFDIIEFSKIIDPCNTNIIHIFSRYRIHLYNVVRFYLYPHLESQKNIVNRL